PAGRRGEVREIGGKVQKARISRIRSISVHYSAPFRIDDCNHNYDCLYIREADLYRTTKRGLVRSKDPVPWDIRRLSIFKNVIIFHSKNARGDYLIIRIATVITVLTASATTV